MTQLPVALPAAAWTRRIHCIASQFSHATSFFTVRRGRVEERTGAGASQEDNYPAAFVLSKMFLKRHRSAMRA